MANSRAVFFDDVLSYSDLFDETQIPVIRIQKIVLDNVKGVEHGEVEFNTFKNAAEEMSSSSILGIYGQNGSGKTTLIEVLGVLKKVMSGENVPFGARHLISNGYDSAKIQVVFESRLNNSKYIDYITYSFSIKYNADRADTSVYSKIDGIDNTGVLIDDEVITINTRDFDGKLVKKTHWLFDTNSKNTSLNGLRKNVKVFTGLQNYGIAEDNYLELNMEYDISRDEAIKYGMSSLFYFRGPADCYRNRLPITENLDFYPVVVDHEDEAYVTAAHLKTFAIEKLLIADLKYSVVGHSYGIPFYFGNELEVFENSHIYVNKGNLDKFNASMERLNAVLQAVVPGMSVETEKIQIVQYGNIKDEDIIYRIAVFTKRGDVRIPFENESEGIKRIIGSLDLFIAAYSDPGVTAAIDEFDAGIYEFLLGELLAVFESSGKGQLIFTSHNLRPLEVISRKFICFSTSNPKNRYIRLKYIGATNNLRDVYLKEILKDDQPEEMYKRIGRSELIKALGKAGDID